MEKESGIANTTRERSESSASMPYYGMTLPSQWSIPMGGQNNHYDEKAFMPNFDCKLELPSESPMLNPMRKTSFNIDNLLGLAGCAVDQVPGPDTVAQSVPLGDDNHEGVIYIYTLYYIYSY